MLIEIQIALKQFIEGGAFNHSFGESEIAKDNAVVACVAGRSQPLDERVKVLVGWLVHYNVLMGLRTVQRDQIARNILGYADRVDGAKIAGKSEILRHFLALEKAIRENTELTVRPGEPRNIGSLTSKALWCCFPFDVPLLDSFAENSLSVLCRLLPVSVSPSPSRYERFLGAWFQVYEIVQDKIVVRAEYPYKVRYLDLFLWWLGQGSFLSESEAPRDAENGMA